LNNAARGSWQYFKDAAFPIRFIHQAGRNTYEEIALEFEQTGLEGEVLPFIDQMPGAFEQADIVICRSGAGAISELAAAGKPSILAPLPTAADNHQLHNAQAFERAGAARLVLDREMDGKRLFEEVRALASDPAALRAMAEKARGFAHPGAAKRAADLLEAEA
jgi:UDP-N-acetylglucosamine--N-acetylmuramyl-(pentapeptide) pyrophosphoryl-undecaprenol N-acetylglucosamine transferase